MVAIHNKNGQGLLQVVQEHYRALVKLSQSTIKMDKGYYSNQIEWIYNPTEAM